MNSLVNDKPIGKDTKLWVFLSRASRRSHTHIIDQILSETEERLNSFFSNNPISLSRVDESLPRRSLQEEGDGTLFFRADNASEMEYTDEGMNMDHIWLPKPHYGFYYQKDKLLLCTFEIVGNPNGWDQDERCLFNRNMIVPVGNIVLSLVPFVPFEEKSINNWWEKDIYNGID